MRRYLLRTLLFWAISLPLFYLFGLPLLMDKLSAKARSESYAQCSEQLKQPNMAGAVPSDKADSYCHCVSDGLTFTQADLRDAISKKPPAAITALQTSLVEKCNRELQQPPQPTVPATPAAGSPIEIR